jgi:tetratricopeptide (TPR) repeat protein
MTIICSNCGRSLPSYEAFCPHCGSPQPIDQAQGTPQSQSELGTGENLPGPAESAGQALETGRRRWTPWRAMGACLLAFACILLIFAGIGGVAAYQGLQERVALNREQATIHYERGLAHLQAKEYELAIAEFEHTLRLDPTHREARDALREAKTTAVTQPTPTSATLNEATLAIFTEAETLFQQGNWEEAVQRLTQVRDLAPDFRAQDVSDMMYTAYFKLGTQLVSNKQVDEGIHVLEQALAEKPGDLDASRQLDLASLYSSAQVTWGADWPSTIDYLEQLYTLTPDYLDTKNVLYEAYESYGDGLVAEEAWCLAELQYKEATMLKPGGAIQAKWDQAARVCRTPTPTPGTPRPAGTRAPSITGTSTLAATAASTSTTSPALGSILFSRFNEKAARWEILAANPGGSNPTVVLADATQPAASPNGRLLAYHAEVDESEGLHIFDIATGEDIRITTYREDATPDWAPDNLRLVFPSQRSGDRRWQIYLGWADGKGESVSLIDGRTPGEAHQPFTHRKKATAPLPGLLAVPGWISASPTRASPRNPGALQTTQAASWYLCQHAAEIGNSTWLTSRLGR